MRTEDEKLKTFIQGEGRLMEWAGEVERLIREVSAGSEEDEAEGLVE